MYRRIDMQVVSHLFRVAAGLDSMVLGEPQILGQVTQGYEKARDAGTTGKILSRLFQNAIHAGKRVRTETALGRNSTSIPSIAAKLVMKWHPDLSEIEIVVLGAGEMAELAIEALRKRGAMNLHVVSRTLASACQLADRWNGDASTMDTLLEVLPRADVLISSSSAPHSLINKEIASDAMAERPSRPLVIIDIAVPRDVEADVGDLPSIHLYDIDALNSDLDDGLNARQREIPKVEAILDQEYLKFKKFSDSLEVVPFIIQLRDHTEAIRRQELEKVVRKLGEISQEQEEQISTLTHSIVNKILHSPTVGLQDAVREDDFDRYLEAARILFGLDSSVEQGPAG
jgi:glutamyl-tRNA reductase